MLFYAADWCIIFTVNLYNNDNKQQLLNITSFSLIFRHNAIIVLNKWYMLQVINTKTDATLLDLIVFYLFLERMCFSGRSLQWNLSRCNLFTITVYKQEHR